MAGVCHGVCGHVSHDNDTNGETKTARDRLLKDEIPSYSSDKMLCFQIKVTFLVLLTNYLDLLFPYIKSYLTHMGLLYDIVFSIYQLIHDISKL